MRILLALLWISVAYRVNAQERILFTNTEHVEDLLLHQDQLYVASRGGVEIYDPVSGERRFHYTTTHGLSSNHVVSLRVVSGRINAHTLHAICTLEEEERFLCTDREQPFAPRIRPRSSWQGQRISAIVDIKDTRFIGTWGSGVHRVQGEQSTRLTPDGQICSNHISDIVQHEGWIVFGAFADGLCRIETENVDEKRFEILQTPFRMINDLESTPHGLYVAANEGLFLSHDGFSFERLRERAIPRGANGLSFDGASLWVTTPSALHRLRVVRNGPPTRSWWRPAGSTALQDVSLAQDGKPGVWLVSEDRGAIRFLPGNDRDDVNLEVFDRAAGLPSSWTYSVDSSSDGRTLVGTLHHGLIAIDQEGSYQTIDLPDAWLLRVRAHHDLFYVGTQGGAFLVHHQDVVPIPNMPDPRVHELRTIKNQLWIGTEGGTLLVSNWNAQSFLEGGLVSQ